MRWLQRQGMLQGNVLRSTKGIQMLPNLEELDLRHNLIASVHEVVQLSGTNIKVKASAMHPLRASHTHPCTPK